MSLIQKLRFVQAALRSGTLSKMDRLLVLIGLLMLAAIPFLAWTGARLFAYGVHPEALGLVVLGGMCAVGWGVAWRVAVDVPMGHAWFRLREVSRFLAAMVGLCALIDASERQWDQFLLDLFFLSIIWRWGWGGGGGGGWDDPIDAPQPSSSGAA